MKKTTAHPLTDRLIAKKLTKPDFTSHAEPVAKYREVSAFQAHTSAGKGIGQNP